MDSELVEDRKLLGHITGCGEEAERQLAATTSDTLTPLLQALAVPIAGKTNASVESKIAADSRQHRLAAFRSQRQLLHIVVAAEEVAEQLHKWRHETQLRAASRTVVVYQRSDAQDGATQSPREAASATLRAFLMVRCDAVKQPSGSSSSLCLSMQVDDAVWTRLTSRRSSAIGPPTAAEASRPQHMPSRAGRWLRAKVRYVDPDGRFYLLEHYGRSRWFHNGKVLTSSSGGRTSDLPDRHVLERACTRCTLSSDVILATRRNVFNALHKAIDGGMLIDEVIAMASDMQLIRWKELSWRQHHVGHVSTKALLSTCLDLQQEAFLRAVVGPRDGSDVYKPLHVLHGPPGTGKTWTMACAIAQLVTEYPNARVLVCEPTNASMQAMVEALQSTKIFRGQSEEHSMSSKPLLLCLAARGSLPGHPSLCREFVRPLAAGRVAWRSARVAVCLLDAAGALSLDKRAKESASSAFPSDAPHRYRRADDPFTHVVVDDAGSMHESAWMQATSFVNWRRCGDPLVCAPTVLVLVGDVKQQVLAPTHGFGGTLPSTGKPASPLGRILSSAMCSSRPSAPAGTNRKPKATLTTLHPVAEVAVALRTNHRSHPSVVDMISTVFYNRIQLASTQTRLMTGDEFTQSSRKVFFAADTVTICGVAKSGVASLFLDIDRSVRDDHKSLQSTIGLDVETTCAALIGELMQTSLGQEVGDGVGVIILGAPHDVLQMTVAINRRLEALVPSLLSAIEVGGVEQFQGRQKKLVVIAVAMTMRSSQLSSFDYLDCPRRTNVGLSRAVERQIIVGHAGWLSNRSRYWKAVIDHHKLNGAFTRLFCKVR